MSNETTYSTKHITISCIIALLLIAILGGFSYILVMAMMSRYSSDSIVINLSGRQRMLSQKLTKELLLIHYEDTAEEKAYYLGLLKDTLTEWSRVHKGLKMGDRELGLPGDNSKEVQNFFKEIEPHYQRMVEGVSKVLSMSPAELAQLTPSSPLVQEILKASSSYLQLMDRIVFQYDRETREKIKDAMQIVTLVAFTAFILLVVIGLFIFRPMVKRIKESYREIQKKEEVLRQSQKMEAIGLLAGGVAHDFNNLLTVVQGYAELTMMKLGEGNPLYKNLKQIHSAALKGCSITKQLLLFSRPQIEEFTPANLNSLIEELLKFLTSLMGEDITINVELEPHLLMVEVNKGAIEQVVMNLALNARDAMPKGGRFTIKTENVEIDDDYCRLNTSARPGKFVCLSVQDTGIGMDKEVIGHIFEPFFSKKEVGKGTGLGLSVVYGIIKQHRGWITVDSELGKGSIFKVYLPAVEGSKVGNEAKKPVTLPECQGKGERILIVEDKEEVRRFIKQMLSENGYNVFEAKDAEDALAIFEREKGDFHLLLSDVVMPGKGGLELAEELLSRKPSLKVILSSGYSNYKAKISLIHEKGYRFLPKPYSLPDLLQAIREAIGD